MTSEQLISAFIEECKNYVPPETKIYTKESVTAMKKADKEFRELMEKTKVKKNV